MDTFELSEPLCTFCRQNPWKISLNVTIGRLVYSLGLSAQFR